MQAKLTQFQADMQQVKASAEEARVEALHEASSLKQRLREMHARVAPPPPPPGVDPKSLPPSRRPASQRPCRLSSPTALAAPST